jgi:hypothetical protein
MDICPRSSVFVLSCVGSGLATGPIPRPRSCISSLQDPLFHVNSDEKHTRGSNPSRQKKKKKNIKKKEEEKEERLIRKGNMSIS